MDLSGFEDRVPEDCEEQRNGSLSVGSLGDSWKNDGGGGGGGYVQLTLFASWVTDPMHMPQYFLCK